MRDRCPSCGSERVRGAATDLPGGGHLYERRCDECGLSEVRRSEERDLESWLGRWEGFGQPSPKAPSRGDPPKDPPMPVLEGRDDEERALLAAVLDAPDADEPRLAHADWLDARGDSRGELIRVQLALAEVLKGPHPTHDDWAPLHRRARELLHHGGPNALSPLMGAKGITTALHHRGFVERITLPLALFLERFEVIIRAEPIRMVRITEAGDRVSELLASPHLSRLRALTLDGRDRTHVSEDDVAAIAQQPALSGLRWLDLYGHELGADALEHIAASPHLRELRYLGFRANAVEPPEDVVAMDRDVIVAVGTTGTGRALEKRHGRLEWLHWPERLAGIGALHDAFV